MKKAIKIISYVGVLGCLLVQYYWNQGLSANRTKADAKTLASKLIGAKANPDYLHRNRLVIAFTSSSIFARASAPFYSRLLNELHKSYSDKVATVAVVPETKNNAKLYVAQTLKLDFDEIVPELPGLTFAAAPTIVLLDRRGTVKNAWVGFLRPQAEEEVMRAVQQWDRGEE